MFGRGGQNFSPSPHTLMDEPLDRLIRPLAALMGWFEHSRIRAAIIGGVAVSLRAKPRLAEAIYAVVLERIPSLCWKALRRVADAIEFALRTRVLLLRHAPTGIDVDVSLGALPFEEEVVDRSE